MLNSYPVRLSRTRVVQLALLLLLVPATLLASAEGRFERTLTVNGKPDVQIETGSGSVQVRVGGANQVKIVGTVRVTSWFSNEQSRVDEIVKQPPITQAGNLIKIGPLDNGFSTGGISISYEVTLPAESFVKASTGSGSHDISDVAGGAQLSSGSGHIRMANLKGSVKAHTGSGGISASNLNGNLQADTGSGEIEVRQSSLSDVDLRTGSGSIHVDNVSKRLVAHTGSGGVEISGTPGAGWEVQTGSGSVRLNIPQQAGYQADLRAGSGGVHIDNEVKIAGNVDRHSIMGTVRGGGPTLRVRTGSGSIEIR